MAPTPRQGDPTISGQRYQDLPSEVFAISDEMSEYVTKKNVDTMPRLPIEGSLDLTYRCNNNCRHCWVRIPFDAPESRLEMTFEEIRSIVDQARALGTREWNLSGGEPLVRPDFADIFEYITNKSATYTLNTNGTLINPKIARLLKRRGNKMIALYGATAEVNDHITRNPGSFEATIRGMAYLREAGAAFTVQLIPMKDNYLQWQAMMELARSQSKLVRSGASWLYLSASGSQERNSEIIAQRLAPHEAVKLDEPHLWAEERVRELMDREGMDCAHKGHQDDRLFAGCIENGCGFHIDPYSRMSFCCFVVDPTMRYDLRNGSFQQAWEEFIPSLADLVRGAEEWRKGCGSCEKRFNCRWCPVYGYLETGRFSARVPFLCQLAEETWSHKQTWADRPRRYFEIAGITVQLESSLPMDQVGVGETLQHFEVQGPGKDTVTLRHVFGLPDLEGIDLGFLLHRQAPWAIYRKGDKYIYLAISPDPENPEVHHAAEFDSDYSNGVIYSPVGQQDDILRTGFHDLTLFPTDQILVAQWLAQRQGCYMHAAGAVLEGQGLLVVGQSGAGKSTFTRMLQSEAEILCDDRIIIRRWPDGFKIHGTWSHGEVPDVSPNSAPLKAVLIPRKSRENRLEPVHNAQVIVAGLLACLVKPLVTRDWWAQSLALIDHIVREVPCYEMNFDTSGKIVTHLKDLATDGIR